MYKNNQILLAVVASALFLSSPAFAQAPAEPAAAPAEAAAPAAEGVVAEDAMAAEAAEEEETYVADIEGESERDARKGLGVGLRVSTLGAGVDLIYSLSKHFNLRAQGNFISLDETVEEDGVKYDGKLDFQTLGLLVDYHPFAGSFRLTAGAFQNGNEIGLRATCPPPNGCAVGDVIIRSDNSGTGPTGQAGALSGKIDFKSTAPYAGIGFGNAMKGWPVHFAFDIGVLFQGAPQVDLSATGDATVEPTNPPGPQSPSQDIGANGMVQAQVTAEEQNLQKEVDDFKMYPVVSFTIGYRFSF